MNNIGLNDNYDIELENGQIKRVVDSYQVQMNVKTRLLTIQEEWFLDLAMGLPWFTEMTGRHPDYLLIQSKVANSVYNTEGVVEVLEIVLDMDKANRKLNINFKYTDVFNQTVTGSL